jgi:hypothetical protein
MAINSREQLEPGKAGKASQPAERHSNPEQAIQQAWQLGITCGLFTLAGGVAAINGHPIFGYTIWSLLDAAFIFLLSFGVYKKSRFSALLLFLYYVASNVLLTIDNRQFSGTAAQVVFSFYFLMAVLATFAYHRGGGDAAWMPALGGTLGAGLLLAVAVVSRPAAPVSASAAEVTAHAWKELAPSDAPFTIQMPGEPVRSSQTITLEGGAGTMEVTTYRVQRAQDNSCAVLVYNIPPEVSRDLDPYALFKSAIDSDAGELKGNVVNEKLMYLGRWPGREALIENEQTTFRTLMFLAEERLYRLYAYSAKTGTPSGDAETFLSSFKVTAADGQILTARDPAITVWQRFSPDGGRFSIELPGTPSAGQENVGTSAGSMTVYRFEFKRDDFKEKFSVQYADYPQKLLRKLKTTDTVLTSAAAADIENFRGTLVSQKTLTGTPYPGKELYAENAESGMRVRMFLMEGRVYKVIALAPKNLVFAADEERFLNSFRLIAGGGGRR